MKKQHKTLIASLAMVGAITAFSIGGVVIYGRYSDAAKGMKLQDTRADSDFLLGEKYSNEYEYSFLNTLGESDIKIGKYIPPKTEANENDYGIVIFTESAQEKVLPVNDFISKFKNEHDGQYPLFKIRTSYFSFDNRYLTAVGPDDWAEFATWYVGDSKTPGHLSFGPEAGMISTFQIMPGVEEKGGGAVTLGGYSMSFKERGTITFYPDAFFGSSELYSPYVGGYENRLADYLLTPNESNLPVDFSIDEVKEIVDLFNKINQYHDQNDSSSGASDDQAKLKAFLEAEAQSETSYLRGLSAMSVDLFSKQQYGSKGNFAPHLLALEPTRLEIINNKPVQKYKILIDFFGPNDDSGKSLLQKIGEAFPEILTSGKGYYLDQDENGTYQVKYGDNKFFVASTRIGLAHILSVIDKDFDGFGIDFLKYVSIHEYGHHETLINAKDISEGGVIASSIHSRQPASVDSLVNIDVLNDYFAARTSGLKAVHTDAYGNEITDEEFQVTKSPYIKFRYPDGTLETQELQKGTYIFDDSDPENLHWVYDPTNTMHRGFQPSIEKLQTDFVDAYNKLNNGDGSDLNLYEAYLLNAFDTTSGTLNPQAQIEAYDSLVELYLDSYTNLGGFISNLINTQTNGGITADGYFTPMTLEYFKNGLLEKTSLSGFDGGKQPEDLTVLEFTIFYYFGLENDLFTTLKAKMDPYRDDLEGNKENIINNVLTDYVNVEFNRKITSSGSTLGFYDAEQKSWVSIAETVLKIMDKDPNGVKPVLEVYNGTESADIDLERDYNFLVPEGMEINTKFNLISPKNIKDEEGNSFFDYTKEILKTESPEITDPEEIENIASYNYLKNFLRPFINKLFNLTWSISGPSASEQVHYPDQGLEPQETDMKFSDYVYQFSEVMTRDFVQITLVEEDNQLKNTGDFLGFSQSASSFEYYVDGSISAAYDPSNIETHFNEIAGYVWLAFAKDIIEQDNLSDFQKQIYSDMLKNYSNSKTGRKIINTRLITDNTFLGKSQYLSNGYERDRQQRELLDWGLYNEDGSARTDNLEQFDIRGPRGEVPESWAEAYWFFLLKMRGVGQQNITGFFRDPDLDKVYVYGFLDSASWGENNAGAPQYLAFKDKDTGEIHTEKIYLQDSNSLFYLTKQGDGESRHTIGDEKFVGWSTNRFTAGQYISEDLSTGEYEVYFATDASGTRSNVELSLGQKNSIAENGKTEDQAPTKFIKENNGSITFIVKPRFNGA